MNRVVKEKTHKHMSKVFDIFWGQISCSMCSSQLIMPPKTHHFNNVLYLQVLDRYCALATPKHDEEEERRYPFFRSPPPLILTIG